MQTAIAPLPRHESSPLHESLETAPNRIPITRSICRALEENGLLTGRYELINGEILSKMGQNRPHANTVMLFTVLLMRLFGEEFVQCQIPIEVGDADPEINAPEPDVVALSRRVDAFTDANPDAADILLLVEVSDSTLRYDLHVKATLYARTGILEYWVADITGRRLITHRSPTPTGYLQVVEHDAEAIVTSAARPHDTVRVADLFPLS